jgi:hypothetical protein
MAVASAYSSDLVCKKLSLFTTKGATNSLPEDLCSQKPYRFGHRMQARDPLRLRKAALGGKETWGIAHALFSRLNRLQICSTSPPSSHAAIIALC